MNSKETLKYIRDNSKVVRMTHLNPPSEKFDINHDYEPNYAEQRISLKGVPFIINDYGRHGWDIYFLSVGNDSEKALNEFKKRCM